MSDCEQIASLVEACREWVDGDKCPARAEFILWGKFFNREALGPRCYDHALPHTHLDGRSVEQSAIFDLRPINALADALAKPAYEQVTDGDL